MHSPEEYFFFIFKNIKIKLSTEGVGNIAALMLNDIQ
jgi:hypothetical protein